MLMQRLITTLILIPIVLALIFYGNYWTLGGCIFLITLLAGIECWQLIPISGVMACAVFLLLLFLCVVCSAYVFMGWLVFGLFIWLLMCVAIIFYPASQRYWGYSVIVASLCLLFISLFIQSLIALYFMPQGKLLLVYLLCLVWAADIGAYLTGKYCGQHKLIPQVSPGKSWEGAAGGFILSMSVACYAFFYFNTASLFLWFLLALVIMIISIFGDLFISILKRRCQLKDTGAIIPGHGGILDRLDSLIATMPFFYLGMQFIL